MPFNLSHNLNTKMEEITPQTYLFLRSINVPTLFKYEYINICNLKAQNKKASIQNLYTQICRTSWRLWKFSHQQIKLMFDEYRATHWEAVPNIFEYFISNNGKDNL